MITVGAIDLYWYGIAVSLAIVAGLFLTWVNVRLRRENFDIALDVVLYSIPVSLVLSRLFYVCTHASRFSEHWGSVFYLTSGGLSIYGAFAGFLLALYAYSRRKKICFWHWLDIFALGLIFGLMLIQISNFCLQSSIGVPFPADSDNHSLAEYIVYNRRPQGFEGYIYFRPIALYQAIALGGIFGLACILSAVQIYLKKIRLGNIFIFSMFLAALTRFFAGFFYLCTKAQFLHFGQYLSLGGMVLLLLVYFYRRRNVN